MHAPASAYSMMFIAAHYTASTIGFMEQMFSGGHTVTQDVPSPVDEEGDIVIQATPEQVSAAKSAFADAGIVVYGGQAISVVIGALAQKLGHRFAADAIATALGADEIRSYVADALYHFDGMDGSYDGVYQTQHSHYSFLGNGETAPQYPSH